MKASRTGPEHHASDPRESDCAEREAASNRNPKAGYSLLEILIVLAIIALIAAVVGPRLFGQLDKSKATTAKVQIRSLETALGTMRLDIGRYPTSQEGLKLLVEADPKSVVGWAGPYLTSGVPNDPWGRPYAYQPSPDPERAPVLITYGADGKPGGTGTAADIRSDAGS